MSNASPLINAHLIRLNARYRATRPSHAGLGPCLSHICCDQRSCEVCVGPGSAINSLSQSHGECLLISDESPFGKATAAFDSSGEPTSFSRALYSGLDSNGDSRRRRLPLEQSVPAPRAIRMETVRDRQYAGTIFLGGLNAQVSIR